MQATGTPIQIDAIMRDYAVVNGRRRQVAAEPGGRGFLIGSAAGLVLWTLIGSGVWMLLG